MSRHICDCGEHYSSLGALEACQINNHGHGRPSMATGPQTGEGARVTADRPSSASGDPKAAPTAGGVTAPGAPSHLPWKRHGTSIYFANVAGGFDVRNCPDPERLAEFIHRACNNHESLLDACRDARAWLAGWASAEPYIGILEAAIAKAEGRS